MMIVKMMMMIMVMMIIFMNNNVAPGGSTNDKSVITACDDYNDGNNDHNWDGMGTKQDQQDLQRWSYRALYKEGEGEADRKRDGKTT